MLPITISQPEDTAVIVPGPGTTHASRTLMVNELRLLLAVCPASSSLGEYEEAIMADNVLAKSTLATRHHSFRSLRELYGLSREDPLFRAIRALWEADIEAQPVLALLCGITRDALLRSTAQLVQSIPREHEINAEMVARTIEEAFPGRFKETTCAKIARNALSSWTQSGHLTGHWRKVRTSPPGGPISTTYALYVAHLSGARGNALFQTTWAAVLDAPEGRLRQWAATASHQGWMEFREMGGVTDITFRHLEGGAGRRA